MQQRKMSGWLTEEHGAEVEESCVDDQMRHARWQAVPLICKSYTSVKLLFAWTSMLTYCAGTPLHSIKGPQPYRYMTGLARVTMAGSLHLAVFIGIVAFWQKKSLLDAGKSWMAA